MVSTNHMSIRLCILVLAMVSVTIWQSANALPFGGRYPRGSSSGLISPENFECNYDTYKLTLDTSVDIGGSNNSITSRTATVSGTATCKTRDANSVVTAEGGSCSFEIVYKLPKGEPACNQSGANSSKTYALSCAAEDAQNNPNDVQGSIDCKVGKKEDGKFELMVSNHPCKDSSTCGIDLGWPASGDTCQDVFGDTGGKVLEFTEFFLASKSCGFDDGTTAAHDETRMISFEESFVDLEPVGTTSPDGSEGGPSLSAECFKSGTNPTDKKCYVGAYGPPLSMFVGAKTKPESGCNRDDTPESAENSSSCNGDGKLGDHAMSDTNDTNGGPKDSDDYWFRFTAPVANLRFKLLDFRADGGAGGKKNETATLSMYSDSAFNDEIGSWKYKIRCGKKCDPDGNVLQFGPDVNEGSTAIATTGIRSASVKFSGNGDVGTAIDDVTYAEVQTEGGPLLHRFCTQTTPGNFVPPNGQVFDPLNDCEGPESTGTAQFESDNLRGLGTLSCSNGKLTEGGCGIGSSGKKMLSFKIPKIAAFKDGSGTVPLNPNDIQLGTADAQCQSKGNEYSCKAACNPDIYGDASKNNKAGLVVVSAGTKTEYGSFVQGQCKFRVK